MKTLAAILNDAPYGSERTYSGVWLAAAMTGSHRSGLDALIPWTAWADKALVF